MSPDELRRELSAATQALAKQRNDVNRVRLAVLYSLARANPQDDQRALQLLDNVAKGGPGANSVKQLAVVLQAQIAERQRAVRDEQQRAEAAVQKLEALRQMERSLLRDRSRGRRRWRWRRWRWWRWRWWRWWWRRRRLTRDARGDE